MKGLSFEMILYFLFIYFGILRLKQTNLKSKRSRKPLEQGFFQPFIMISLEEREMEREREREMERERERRERIRVEL